MNGPTLLLVVGAGRSGTSTIAGTLNRLGYVVPEPMVPADDTNPRGFYEPQWVVDFHMRVLDDIGVRANDTRPEAVAATAAAGAKDELLAELTEWLKPQAQHPFTVVKDPRTFWFHDLWRRAASGAGMDLAFLTMLRHPAAVARSRDTHYLSGRDAERRRARETSNVAAWCHNTLVTEVLTRGDRRAFMFYTDLMADWRSALRHADRSLGLDLAAGFDDGPHAVDDFIEPSLNRSTVSWDELSVHPEVRDLAEELWGHLDRLVAQPGDAATLAALDAMHERYDGLYSLARDLTLDQTTVNLEDHRKRRRALRERVQQLTEQVEGLSRRNQELEEELRLARRPLATRLVGRLHRS